MAERHAYCFEHVRIALRAQHLGEDTEALLRKNSVWYSQLTKYVCAQHSLSTDGAEAQTFSGRQNFRSTSAMENHDRFPGCMFILLVQGESDQLPGGTRIAALWLHKITRRRHASG